MPESSHLAFFLKRAVAWLLVWVLSAGLYLLLIDTTSLPELIVGAVAVALAATGFELAREQHIVGASLRGAWLKGIYRPLAKVPGDIAFVSMCALTQLTRRDAQRGEFRAVRFRRREGEQLETGRHALAESLGSFAPNTIIIGVDSERELILAHQLHRSGGREAIDLLGLG